MTCKDMNRVIEDTPIYVRQWPASVALENMTEAVQVLGPSFGSFIEGKYTLNDIIAVMSGVDKHTLVPLLKRFVSAARVDGKEIQEGTFNITFSGDLMKVFKILAFVCEVNYKDFFEQGLELNAQRKEEAMQNSKEQVQSQTSIP
ncbi:hypothetical protein [Vibrio phage vB_VpaM_VPs20]|uniref:Uncharacterized protein n=1 Tax=Vibrio phage vB_VpaM_VPs20 TaxID=2978980 RepID=A0A9X9NZT0_9CAUD|nr:hypothetical protein QNH06_gp23 [Vibrio phage vB_VpaM_VPs20]UYD72123.1 hypothetical protein [Vibrio phage vB_VpaM_VPs20]